MKVKAGLVSMNLKSADAVIKGADN